MSRSEAEIRITTSMYDIRKWMELFRTELHYIINPHAFHIRKDEDGAVIMSYKNWASKEEESWKPNRKDNPEDPDRRIVLLEVFTIRFRQENYTSTCIYFTLPLSSVFVTQKSCSRDN